jgi:ribulose-5-phosphate 4-epimerase/fuculose-1-phosphate aldolase
MTSYAEVKSMAELRVQPRTESERELRRKLAAAYRIFDYFGWTSLIFGHITVRVPGPDRHFLINPFGLRYDEVTASSLVKIDLQGRIVEPSNYPVNPAGFIIHSTVHAARVDAHCVMHAHTQSGMIIAATRDGLQLLDFAGAGLYDRVAYHDFAGVHADDSDRENLVKSLGERNMMIMWNHGLLSCGPTIASAFNRFYTLDTACKVQAAAQALNVPLRQVPPEVAAVHAATLDKGDNGELAFAAFYRLMEKRDPSFLE